MSTIALVLLAVAAALFLARLFIGPGVPDRVIALDGLLVTVMCGILVAAARAESAVAVDTVLVVALLSFVATGVLARYIEKRGG